MILPPFDFDKLKCGRLTDIFMCAVTFAIYLLTLPLDVLLGVPFRCLPRLVKKIPPQVEWAVVMGCGYDISPNLLNSRLETALQLYRQCPTIKFLLSGTDNEKYPEPRYMKNYLRQHGIPTENLFCDGKGFNTAETFKNVRRMKIARALIVTSDFHLLRCVDTARLYGVDAYGRAVPLVNPATHPYRWRYWFREKLAHYWGYGRFLIERLKNANDA